MRLTACVAAYNEERTIAQALMALDASLRTIKGIDADMFVCCNGCDDRTFEVARAIARTLDTPTKVITGPRGKMNAHRRMIARIKHSGRVLFVDADTIVTADALRKLLSTMREDRDARIVSAYPYLTRAPNPVLEFRKLTLNIKRIYPQIEIARKDVSAFHKNAPVGFTKRSRIYFHGRCFLIRTTRTYLFPRRKSEVRGDDTFLTRAILHRYGPGSIRIRFDAKIYCAPTRTVREYVRTSIRIRKDIDEILREHPEFISIEPYTKVRLDMRCVIRDLPKRHLLHALSFAIIDVLGRAAYVILRSRVSTDSVWRYATKEPVLPHEYHHP